MHHVGIEGGVVVHEQHVVGLGGHGERERGVERAREPDALGQRDDALLSERRTSRSRGSRRRTRRRRRAPPCGGRSARRAPKGTRGATRPRRGLRGRRGRRAHARRRRWRLGIRSCDALPARRRRLARGDPGTAEGGRRRPPSDATSSRSALLRGALPRGGLARRRLRGPQACGPRTCEPQAYERPSSCGRGLASRGLLGRPSCAPPACERPSCARPACGESRSSWPQACEPRSSWLRSCAPPACERRVFFAAVLRAAGFLAAVFLAAAMLPPFGAFAQFRTPCASGVGVPVRSSRPTRRSAHRGGVRSSDIRCARDTRCRSAWPPSMSLPSRGRKPLGRTRDTVLVLAKGCSDARFVSPRNHIRVILREEHPR